MCERRYYWRTRIGVEHSMSKEEREYYEYVIKTLREIREEISNMLKRWMYDLFGFDWFKDIESF